MITLWEFIEQEKARIAAFQAMWETEMAKAETTEDGDPLYPSAMNPGDWDDQYLQFGEGADG